jgi:hypothetical protein
MKKILLASLAAGMFLVGMVGIAQALPLTINSGTIVVGNVDTLIAWAQQGSTELPSSGDPKEIAWVNKETGEKYTLPADLVKTEETDPTWKPNWYAVDSQSGTYAFDFLTDTPDYFYLKIGNNTDGTYTHFLFQNIDSLNWGVITLNLNLDGANLTIDNFGKLSHLGEVGGNHAPEPATMILFGTGIVGLVGVYRRKRK